MSSLFWDKGLIGIYLSDVISAVQDGQANQVSTFKASAHVIPTIIPLVIRSHVTETNISGMGKHVLFTEKDKKTFNGKEYGFVILLQQSEELGK